ncbi:MAG: selenocysteine synthase, partial [Neobacillus sp.]|nr:selenocysteine synthase [Neobacillus sp.]
MKEWLRSIPAVHELQNHKLFESLLRENHLDVTQLTKLLKEALDQIRSLLINGDWNGAIPGTNQFIDDVFQLLGGNIKKQYS